MKIANKHKKFFKGCCNKCSIEIEGTAEEMDKIEFNVSYLTYFGIIKCPKCKTTITLPEAYKGIQRLLHFFDGADMVC